MHSHAQKGTEELLWDSVSCVSIKGGFVIQFNTIYFRLCLGRNFIARFMIYKSTNRNCLKVIGATWKGFLCYSV